MEEWEKPKLVKSSKLVVIPSIYGYTKDKKQEIIERMMDTNEVIPFLDEDAPN